MSETHRLGAILSATFLLVVLGMSFASEVASVEVASGTESNTVAVIPRERPVPTPPAPEQRAALIMAFTEVEPEDEVIETAPSDTATPAPVEAVDASPALPKPVATVPTPSVQSDVPATVVTRSVATAPKSSDILTKLATAIHAETNVARKAAGLPALSYDTTLARNATGYSQELVQSGVLSHTDPNGCSMTCRFKLSGYEALAWGENLAQWQSSYEPTIDELVEYFVDAWLRSDGHRDNILSPNFTHEGIGVARDGNTFYVTVHFAKP